jgi:hypothetical protein
MKTVWMIAVTGAFLSTAAMAQTPAQTPAAPAQTPSSSAAQSHATLQQQMKSDLQKAGFTDVAVRPDSFLVQAKDKSGNPVTMMIDPDSMTEVVAADVGNPAGGTAANQGASSFTTVNGSEALGSKIIGTEVHNSKNQDIGTIKDIAYSGQRIKAYVVGVGGFLGVGDHDVAVTPSALHVSYDSNAKTWHATMNATADQLKAAPEFKYAT